MGVLLGDFFFFFWFCYDAEAGSLPPAPLGGVAVSVVQHCFFLLFCALDVSGPRPACETVVPGGDVTVVDAR